MPARPRTAVKAASRAPRPRAKPLGTFARLRAEAAKGQPPLEPYIIDDAEPPISIEPPSTIEQQVDLAGLFSNTGDFKIKDARRILEIICGDAFPEVWELVRHEHIQVLVAFIRDLADHFATAIDVGADDFPGGS